MIAELRVGAKDRAFASTPVIYEVLISQAAHTRNRNGCLLHGEWQHQQGCLQSRGEAECLNQGSIQGPLFPISFTVCI